MSRRHDFDQKLVTACLHRIVEGANLRLVLQPVDDIVIRMQRHEAFDDVLDRPGK